MKGRPKIPKSRYGKLDPEVRGSSGVPKVRKSRKPTMRQKVKM